MGADAGAAGEAFIRFWDQPCWDKSRMAHEVARFRSALHAMFIKGQVLDCVLGAGTYTQRILQGGLRDEQAYLAGRRVVCASKVASTQSCLPILMQWQAWVKLVNAELDAEFLDFEALQSFAIFDLHPECLASNPDGLSPNAEGFASLGKRCANLPQCSRIP